MDHLNLNGTVLRITTRYDNSYPYDVQLENVSLANGSTLPLLQGGYTINILLELSRMLNFRVGHLDFEKAAEERIDLFAYSSSLRLERAQLVDFSYVMEQSRILAFMNHVFEGSGKDTLLDPFSTPLWIAVLLLIALTSLLTLGVALSEEENVLDAQFQCVALILQKDTLFQFRRSGSKSILWISSISFIIITGTYGGNLISIKSVTRYKISSLESLLDSHYSILLEYGNTETQNGVSTVLQIAKTGEASGWDIMGKVLRKCAKSKYEFQSFEKAMEDVNKHPLAYVVDAETGYSAIVSRIGYFPCTWTTISFAGIKYPWTMYMRKNAPYRKNINSGLLILDERGVRHRIRNKWLTVGFGDCTKDTPDFLPITYSELEFGYVTLASGFLGSILVVLFEVGCHKLKACLPLF